MNHDNPLTSNILSPLEIRKYANQINRKEIGLEGQEKIKLAKVLVVGAGVKGTAILQNLVTAGIGQVGICDFQPVQEKDLYGQYLYGNGDIGKQKAIISKQKLSEINSLVRFELYNVAATEQNIDFIVRNYSVIIDSTDNFIAHYLINDTAIRLNKPLIFSSILDPFGIVSVFNYKEGPSLRSAFPNPPDQNININSSVNLTLLAGMVGSIIGNETLKLILNLDTQLNGNLLKFNSANYSLFLENVK